MLYSYMCTHCHWDFNKFPKSQTTRFGKRAYHTLSVQTIVRKYLFFYMKKCIIFKTVYIIFLLYEPCLLHFTGQAGHGRGRLLEKKKRQLREPLAIFLNYLFICTDCTHLNIVAILNLACCSFSIQGLTVSCILLRSRQSANHFR